MSQTHLTLPSHLCFILNCSLSENFSSKPSWLLTGVTTLQIMWNSPTFPPRFTALGMLSVTHIMTDLVLLSVVGVGMQQYMIQNQNNRLLLNTCMDKNMQFTINSFRQLFPDKIISQTISWFSVKSLTFPWQLSDSLTFPGFPDKWSPCIKCIDSTLLSQQHTSERMKQFLNHLWLLFTA